MRNDKLTETEREVVSNNDNLFHYLESLIAGRKATDRSWLYDGHNSPKMEPDEILHAWISKLEVLKTGNDFEQEVFQFDISQEAKWGPQGEVAPISELMSIVEEGYKLAEQPEPEVFSSSEWQLAVKLIGKDLAHLTGGALRPASYQHVVDDMRARDTLESNSGWPLFSRRSWPAVVASSIRDAEDGTWKNYPAIALFRNYNQKTRLVWMFPMATNIVEGSFFQPLQSAIIRSKDRPREVAPWVGFDECRSLISLIYHFPGKKFQPTISASDFSSTDAHFTKHHSKQVFEAIKWCFQRKYWDALFESMMHLHDIELIVGPDAKLTGSHGVSSGSNWTNFVETIFDMILGQYVDIIGPRLGYATENYMDHDRIWHARCLYAIGDDMAWYCDWYNPEFAKQLEAIGEDIGQVIKADKTTNYPGKVKTLQRLFQRGYDRSDGKTRAVYPTVRALKSSVYPERFHKPKDWNKDMFCARQFMILENCVDHPLFEEFVKFICAGNAHLPAFARKSAKELDKITRQTKLLPGFNPTYNQERRDSSLSQFESIRIASQL
nr:MAG: putative RNA-dependent RNA polymerase [Picobirnavirus sp.]